jgi:hypothetical protein
LRAGRKSCDMVPAPSIPIAADQAVFAMKSKRGASS